MHLEKSHFVIFVFNCVISSFACNFSLLKDVVFRARHLLSCNLLYWVTCLCGLSEKMFLK